MFAYMVLRRGRAVRVLAGENADVMGNPSARHQLVCAIVHEYPDAAVAVADALGVLLPEHDDVQAMPDSHYAEDGNTIYGDATVRLLRNGKPVFFLAVEMQRRHEKGKYATMVAYHGSGVRRANAGGRVLVLSDNAAESAKFRREDAERRAELAFAAAFGSRSEVEPIRSKDGLSLGAHGTRRVRGLQHGGAAMDRGRAAETV
jgi:hypothetical protein